MNPAMNSNVIQDSNTNLTEQMATANRPASHLQVDANATLNPEQAQYTTPLAPWEINALAQLSSDASNAIVANYRSEEKNLTHLFEESQSLIVMNTGSGLVTETKAIQDSDNMNVPTTIMLWRQDPENGTLNNIGHAITVEEPIDARALSPDNQTLLIASDGMIWAYRINADSELPFQSEAYFNIGDNGKIESIEFTAQDVFTINFSDHSVNVGLGKGEMQERAATQNHTEINDSNGTTINIAA